MPICPNCGQEIAKSDAVYCPFCGASLDQYRNSSTEMAEREAINHCDFCGRSVPYSEFFACKYCGKKFCYDHRLPENHICKSVSSRRVIPGNYASSGSYSYSSSYRPQRTTTFGINFSKQGRNLVILVLLGIPIGIALSLAGNLFVPSVGSVPLYLFFVQWNYLVYAGWGIPSLLTSLIVTPGLAATLLSVEDAGFNAFALFMLDRLLVQTYSSRQYYAVFVITGLAGNLLTLVQGPGLISFGASGGIFGLIAGAVTNDYAVNKRFNMSLAGWFVIVFFISTFLNPSINVLAHLGGALVGLLVGFVIGRRKLARY